MKAKIFTLLASFFIVLGTVFAQYPSLGGVYTKIDRILEKNPAAAELIVEKLSLLAEQYAYVQEDYDLIMNLKEYVQEKSKPKPIIGSLFGSPIPQGFGQLTVQYLKEIEQSLHLHGEESAPIRVIEFIDFQCPYCQKQHKNGVLDTLEYDIFPGKVRTGVAMFPLGGSRHALAQQAAESAECAYDQGGTEAYLSHKSALFASGLQPTMTVIKRAARDKGLDPEQIETCVTQGVTTKRVQDQKQLGINLGITGTPGSVIIDARTGAFRKISGAQSVKAFEAVVDTLLEIN